MEVRYAVVAFMVAVLAHAACATREQRRRQPAERTEVSHDYGGGASVESERLIFGSKQKSGTKPQALQRSAEETVTMLGASNRRRAHIAQQRFDGLVAEPTPFAAPPQSSHSDESVMALDSEEPTTRPLSSRPRSRYVLPIQSDLHADGAASAHGRPTNLIPNSNWPLHSRSAAPAARRRPAKATTTTSSTTTTTTSTNTPQSNLFENLQRNPFNIFSPNFWSHTTITPPIVTRHPPKKYHNIGSTAASKEEKLLAIQKPKAAPPRRGALPAALPTKQATPGNTTAKTDGPFRIALPTLNLLSAQPQPNAAKEKEKRATVANLRMLYNCPRESEVRFQLFPKICQVDQDCSIWNRNELCCDIFGAKSCVSGIPKPLEESAHTPLLGVIPRKCPTRPLAELWWDVKECDSDQDCWPRLCCPDGRRRYCRTSHPELEAAPVPVKRSFNYLTEYLECTAPPPPIFDLHPRACTSTLDCFPNVCCQEAGLRHCRPPKKSVLTLMANFLNVDFVKRLTQNIVIK